MVVAITVNNKNMKDFRKGNLVRFVNSNNNGHGPYSIPVIIEEVKNKKVMLFGGDEVHINDLCYKNVDTETYNEILSQVWKNKNVHIKHEKGIVILNGEKIMYANDVQNKILDDFGINIDLSGVLNN